MSTSQDLKNSKPCFVRKVYTGKTLSINIPLKLSKIAGIKNDDYLFSYLDENNRLIFERVNTGLEKNV